MYTRSQSAEMPTNAARFDELDSKLVKVLALQTATNTLVSSLLTRVDSIDNKLGVLNGEMHTHTAQLSAQRGRIDELQRNLDQALEYIDTLENRQREKNLKLLNVPESEENANGIVPFLVDLIETEWGLTLQETDIEKAHRLGPLHQKTRYPRGIMFRVQHFQTKLQILKAINARRANQANSTGVTEPKSCKYRIISDISVQLRKKRDAFWPLREKLHELNIKTKIRHPAVLLVTIGKEELRFPTVCEAQSELCKRYPTIKLGDKADKSRD